MEFLALVKIEWEQSFSESNAQFAGVKVLF